MANDRVDVEALILAVAAKFKQYGMEDHLRRLRVYYAERQRRQRAGWRRRGKDAPPWDEDSVIGWAALWRIPPLDRFYEVRPRFSACQCGEGEGRDKHANFYTGVVFPEGHVINCVSCGACWLELDGNDGGDR